MSNDDDLIRRGDTKSCMPDHWFHAPVYQNSAIAAINALPAAQVKVKPLVWRMAENRRGWEADGLGCQYYVPHDEPDRRKRCEADYEGRILSVLEWKTTISPEVRAEKERLGREILGATVFALPLQ